MKKISLFLLFICSIGFSITINVPTDYPTIQLGLNNASDGDVVLVHDGTYNEYIIWPNVNVSLLSENGSESTIIDGDLTQNRTGMTFGNLNNVDTTSIVEGFTITNFDYYGIEGSNSPTPKFKNLIIVNNNYEGIKIVANNNGYHPIWLENINVDYNGHESSDAVCGVMLQDASKIILKNLTISNNGNPGNNFSLLKFHDLDGPLEFQNVNIINNNGNGYGQSVYVQSLNDVTLENLKIIHSGYNNGNDGCGL